MASSNYVRGRQFEYRTRDKLLKSGAVYVMRAASSKGAADLIALWPRSWVHLDYPYAEPRFNVPAPAWLVQCKRDGKLPRLERETLIDLAEKSAARPVLARVPKSGRGVEFIDLNTKETLVV